MINNNFQPQNFVGSGNGIIMTTVQVGDKDPMHYDENHIRNLIPSLSASADKPDYLGVFESLNQLNPYFGDTKNQLWNLDNGVRKVIEVQNIDGNYYYDVPANDKGNCAKILNVEIKGDQTRPGIDGAEILIRTNTYVSGANSVLEIGSKWDHVELHVLDDPSGSEAEGFLYRTKFITSDSYSKFVPLHFLQKGRSIKASIAVSYEDNRKYDSRALPGATMRRFYNTIGNTVNQKYFHVSRNAALTKIDSNNIITYSLKQHLYMYNMKLMNAKSPVSGIKSRNEEELTAAVMKAYNTNDFNKITAQLKKDTVHNAFVPMLEMYYTALLEKENAYYRMWGNGGTVMVGSDKGYKVQLPIGLFRQAYKSANRYDFELDNFSVTKLADMIFATVQRKYRVSGGKHIVTVKTGSGGLSLARKQINKHYNETMPNVIINGNEFLTDKGGSNKDLGLQFGFGTLYHDLGHIALKFEYAEELDALYFDDNDKDDFDNPYIGNHRLSSYAYIVDNIDGTGSEIYELRNSNLEQDLVTFVEQGKLNYLGAKTSIRSINSIHNDGYTVYFEKPLNAYILKKPDNTWLYLPKNPKTKMTFGQSTVYNF